MQARCDDQIAARVDCRLPAGDEDVTRLRSTNKADLFHLQALAAMGQGDGGEVGFGEAIEDAAAAPRQGLEQLEVLGAESVSQHEA